MKKKPERGKEEKSNLEKGRILKIRPSGKEALMRSLKWVLGKKK